MEKLKKKYKISLEDVPIRKTQLNEGYAISVNNGGKKVLLFVCGKRVTEEVAVTYNHRSGSYSLTAIGTGMSISMSRYYTLRELRKNCMSEIESFRHSMEHDNVKKVIRQAKELFQKMIEEGEYVEQ